MSPTAATAPMGMRISGNTISCTSSGEHFVCHARKSEKGEGDDRGGYESDGQTLEAFGGIRVLKSGAYSREENHRQKKAKAAANDPESGTVRELAKGTHFIGKKIIEEAGEVWIASEYESKERTAEEISQLLYHLQVMMIDQKIELEDIYRYL